jgi:hypothetical protein
VKSEKGKGQKNEVEHKVNLQNPNVCAIVGATEYCSWVTEFGEHGPIGRQSIVRPVFDKPSGEVSIG